MRRDATGNTDRHGVYIHELAVAERTALAAGALLRELRGRALHVREKADRSLVTDADLASETEILARLRDAFPGDSFLSEESGELGPASGRQWIIDPLDGTTNYSRGLPFFAVSIALWEDGEPAAGALYLPVLDELFTATRFTPARLNGVPIRVSGTGHVKDAMINAYFDRHQLLERGLEVFQRVALGCEGRVKIMGSSASMLCYTACGRLDACVRNATKIWDFAAAALVLRQAGGRVSDFEEQPLRRSGQSLMGSNGLIHGELARVVRG